MCVCVFFNFNHFFSVLFLFAPISQMISVAFIAFFIFIESVTCFCYVFIYLYVIQKNNTKYL